MLRLWLRLGHQQDLLLSNPGGEDCSTILLDGILSLLELDSSHIGYEYLFRL